MAVAVACPEPLRDGVLAPRFFTRLVRTLDTLVTFLMCRCRMLDLADLTTARS